MAHDMKVEWVEGEVGVQSLTITAHTEQAAIDLAMERPRIMKLLERDWLQDDET